MSCLTTTHTLFSKHQDTFPPFADSPYLHRRIPFCIAFLCGVSICAMAETSEQEVEQPSLKYLGIFEIAVDKATKYMASIYEFAKESSGPLKPGVDTVESTVKTVVGPVYQKIEGKPYEILLFIDGKVDGAVGAIEGYVPQAVKEKSCQAYGIAKQVPEVAKSVVADVQKGGVVEAAKSYYAKYEPVAEEWSAAAWKQFLKIPYVPKAVHFAAPPTLFCVEKFNDLVVSLKEKQIPLAAYIPSLPTEKIEKALNAEPAAVQ